MTTDDEILATFNRHLAGIEVLVKDPPPWPSLRRSQVRGSTRFIPAGRPTRLTRATTIWLVGAAVAIAVLATRFLPPTAPGSDAGAVSPPSVVLGSVAPSGAPASGGLPSAAPTPTASSDTVTETLGRLRITHPTSWTLFAGPKTADPFGIPIFYLSTEALTVGPCFTPNPAGEYQGCADPLRGRHLAPNGILITATPNAGVLEIIPPRLNVIVPVDIGCHSTGADEEIETVVNGMVVAACLRGPDLAGLEAAFQEFVASVSR